ncbi:MAG: hypothetical protein GQ557_01950 [Mycoplasmataceae bacterium]|nr:hypothetical protein [Mycoplasmataceae bacterium]
MGCFYLIIINYDGKHKKSLPAYIKEFMFYSIQNELRHFVTKANMVMNYADLYLDKYDKVVFENNPLINIVKTLSLVNGKLNYQEQKIFSLLVEEKTPKQISEMLSIPLQTVYQRKAKIFNKATTIISMYD